ncbi:hypothetical protein [Streptomyces sp. NPDC101393]
MIRDQPIKDLPAPQQEAPWNVGVTSRVVLRRVFADGSDIAACRTAEAR